MNRTEEQEHIISSIHSTPFMMIDALAGTGKSTTLRELDWELHAILPTITYGRIEDKSILKLMFNKRNSDEAKADQKEGKIPSEVEIRTFNSLGLAIWQMGFNSKLTVDGKKCREILRNYINEQPKSDREDLWEVFWEVIEGVEVAKAIGYVPDGKWKNAKRLATSEDLVAKLDQQPDGLVWELINEVLFRSITAAYAGALDFNDQVYMPALFGGTFPKFPYVEVDEYQDLNPVNHAMLRRLVTDRLTGVGDPAQCIYVFRGAKANGMQEAVDEYNMCRNSLSVSFRCPEAVVKAARWRVPNFKWHKPGGKVERLKDLSAESLCGDETFICRNNAPLFRLAMQLLSIGKAVTVSGSDLGPKLVGIMRKLGDESLNRSQTISAIEDWRSDKLSRDSTTANDLADCMIVFAQHGDSLGQAIAYAEHLFKQTGSIRLLTGHKSKGLEFDKVYLLDTHLLRDDGQDRNLRYVMQTRSANELYEIDTDQIDFGG